MLTTLFIDFEKADGEKINVIYKLKLLKAYGEFHIIAKNPLKMLAKACPRVIPSAHDHLNGPPYAPAAAHTLAHTHIFGKRYMYGGVH